MKPWLKATLVLYGLALLWLLLFKFSTDILGVLANFQMRSITLVPFADFSHSSRQMIDNIIVFVPLGLLLSANFKQISLWRKLGWMCLLSLAVEVTQFVFAIGVTDITDIITNTLGGFLGLALYRWSAKYVDDRKLDVAIAITTIGLLLLVMTLRFFVLMVKY